MAKLVESLAPEDEDPRPPVLEVEHVVANTEPSVAATGAAFVGVDVEVIDEAVRGPAGHRDEDREQCREGRRAGEATDHCRVS